MHTDAYRNGVNSAMGRMPRWACLWPGLPQLWYRGAWSGLALAVGFTALLNFALVASLVWTEWLSPSWLLGSWLTIAVLWLAAAWVSLQSGVLPEQKEADNTREGTSLEANLYREAQTYYLQGNWFEAERLLNFVLKKNVRDAEARLMLATLLRHTGRATEAVNQLDRLERTEAADRWQQEIQAERRLLARDGVEEDGVEEDGVEEDATSDEVPAADEPKNTNVSDAA